MFSELRIEVNKKCNFACDHCYTDKRGPILPLQDLERTVREARTLGADSLSITGGEPLIDLDRTESLVRLASALGMKTRLNTNGWFASPEVLSGLKRAGLSEIQVSMSHSDRFDFDRFVRRNGAYDKALCAIYNASFFGIHSTIRFTLMADNFSSLVPLYEIGSGVGMTSFKIRSFVQANGVRDNGRTSDQNEKMEFIESLGKVAERCLIPISIADDAQFSLPEGDMLKRLNCKCGKLAVFVTADGIVTPCPFLREDQRYWCGNIKDQSLSSILNGSEVFNEFVGVETTPGCGNDAGCVCKANAVSSESRKRPERRQAVH